MRLLIDTNILLDFLLDRAPYADDAEAIWHLCESGSTDGFVSALSFANLTYIMRKALTPEQIENLLRRIGLFFRFASLTENDLQRAAVLCWKDFEDAVQYATAERLHADCIITRNVIGYGNAGIPALTPKEFVESADLPPHILS